MHNKENFSHTGNVPTPIKNAQVESEWFQFYQSTANECIPRLQDIWKDLEVPQIQINDRLKFVFETSIKVWEHAVNEAEEQRNEMRRGVENAIKEIRKLQEQLGEACTDENLRKSTGTLIKAATTEAQRTMKSVYDEVLNCQNEWQRRKDERVREFEVIHESISELKGQLGQVDVQPLFGNLTPSKFDISQANLEFLVLEKEKLQAEKSRRERKREAMLSRLRKLCIELGEDDLQMAQSVHPSLANYRDSLPGQAVFGGANQSQLSTPQKSKPAVSSKIELGDQLFKSLQGKIDQLNEIKVSRENRATQLLELLSSLWTALDVPDTDLDRSIFTKLLTGSAKLHDKTVEKCVGEVSRLESQKKQQMIAMIQSKEQKLQQMCETSHLLMPDMTPLLDDRQNMDAHGNGQVTNILSKMMRLAQETEQIVQKRAHIVKAIDEINQVREEVEWLTEYEMDDNRFKGRDSNRKLQRSIKAGKQRERLPQLLRRLQQLIEEWEAAEKVTFQYDQYVDYKVEVLEGLLQEQQQSELEKQKGHKLKQQKASKGPQQKPSNNKSSGIHQELGRPQTAQARLTTPTPTTAASIATPFTQPQAEASVIVSTNTPRTPRTHQLSGLMPPPPPTVHQSQIRQPHMVLRPTGNILQDKLNQLIAGSPLPGPQRQKSQEEISAPMECSQGSGHSSVVSANSGPVSSFKIFMQGKPSGLQPSISGGVQVNSIHSTENVAESRGRLTHMSYTDNDSNNNGTDMIIEDENMEP